MTEGSLHPRVEELLEHADWIHALARSLVRDPAAADDLVQETWSAALEHPGSTPGAAQARPWLAAVLKNRWRSWRRAEGRREARERSVAPQEACPPESEMVERVERQRALLDQVLTLDEPYRSTVILRYYEELSTTKIARRLGEPHERVRWRLKRAHALLRERLATRHGSQWSAWCALLLPLGERHPLAPGALATTGVLFMGAKTLILLAAIPLAGLVLWLARDGTASPPSIPAEPAGNAGELASLHPQATTSAPGQGGPSLDLLHSLRSGLPPRAQASAGGEPQPAVPAGTLSGRVLASEDGAPLQDAHITLLASSGPPSNQYVVALREVQSGADGSFELQDVPADEYHLAARLPGRAPLILQGIELGADQTQEVELALQLGRSVQFNVTDTSGLPVQAAEVLVIEGSSKSITRALPDRLTHLSIQAFSDAAGFALIEGVPGGENQVVVRAAGFVNWLGSLDGYRTAEPVEVQLVRGVTLRGRVTRDDGLPLEDVNVFLNPCGAAARLPDFEFVENGVSTAPDGAFELRNVPAGDYYVVALAGDGATGFHTAAGGELETLTLGAAETAWLDLSILRPAQLQGRVLDPHGAPIEGVRIYISWGDFKPDSAGFFPLHWVPDAKQRTHQETFSDEDGRFRVEVVRASYEPLWFDVSRKGYRDEGFELQGRPGEVLERDLVLEPRDATLTGRLAFPPELGGTGIAGVTVGAWAHYGKERELFLGESSEDGSYVVVIPASADHYEVYPILRSHDAYTASPSKLERQSAGTAGLDFALHPKSVLEGRVVDEQGQAVPGYAISLAESLTDEPVVPWEFDLGGGSFRIPLVAADRPHVYFTAPGFGPVHYDLNAAGAPDLGRRLEVVMTRPGDLHGCVIGPDGRGLADALVAFATLDGLVFPLRSSHAPRSRTDASGNFVLHGAPAVAGTVLLIAPERADLPPLIRHPLDGPRAAGTSDVLIQIEAPVEVLLATSARGVLVIDAVGWPLHPEIETTLAGLRSAEHPEFGAATNGAVRFWLTPGEYHFLSADDGLPPAYVGPVRVERDADGPLRIELP